MRLSHKLALGVFVGSGAALFLFHGTAHAAPPPHPRRCSAQTVTGVTHLMTGRDLDGNVVGISYMNSVCNGDSADSLSEGAHSTLESALIAAGVATLVASRIALAARVTLAAMIAMVTALVAVTTVPGG